MTDEVGHDDVKFELEEADPENDNGSDADDYNTNGKPYDAPENNLTEA